MAQEQTAIISDYAQELITVPRAHLRMELSQDDNGLTLTHDGQTLVQCPLTSEGMMAGGFMAKALGTRIPPLGESVPVRVSTGVLFRAISIADLDYTKPESSIVLERLLEEADDQRRTRGVSEA